MKNSRNTFQRIRIIDYLKNTKTHPSAEMVYNEVSKEMPTISLATVYRNLNILASQGKIIRFEINGEYRFDGFIGMHQHLVCLNCGKIFDLEKKEINQFIVNKMKTERFELKNINIIMHGVCDNCKKLEVKNDKKS